MLRTVKYGETSVIVSIFTELFGVQSYLVNGVRTSSKKGSGKANLFQPVAILDLVVYHNDLKQLQRIREFRWGVLYNHIYSDVRRNSVSLFMIELLTKCLRQPESNPELYEFVQDAFINLDSCPDGVVANFPLFFALHLPVFFGFRISPPRPLMVTDEAAHLYLDLEEGEFVPIQPNHPHFLDGKQAYIVSLLLKAQRPGELEDIKLNHEFRRNLLFVMERFYALHIQDFGTMKTLPVLRELLG